LGRQKVPDHILVPRNHLALAALLPPEPFRGADVRFDMLAGSWDHVTLRQAMVAFPVAFAAHVYEEWSRFPTWAQRYASSTYTRRDYWITHLAGLLSGVLAPVLLWSLPSSWLAFVLFTFVLIPSMGWNALFHAGATVVYRAYCPGVVTAGCALSTALVSSQPRGPARGGTVARYAIGCSRRRWGFPCCGSQP
jgi:hypothetical protein